MVLNRNSEPAFRRIASSAAVLTLAIAFSILALHPPHGKSASAPPNEFSAARALAMLHGVLGDDMPHPIGSSANDAVRGRILAELTRLGYQPAVHTGFACGDSGQCATVNNILARLDGTRPGEAVLLSAHYDSVAAGPGDADDGAGMASVLEIARALKSTPPPRHSIILLLDDGEEPGLLGARAFVYSDPWARQIRADVNLDNRGASGPALMFETGSANNWALNLYARNATHHVTSSIFYTIYKLLPNDTDFTVFKNAGYQGLNFAFVGRVAVYHTPLDNFGNLSLSSLQDQGANGLASVLALANANFPAGSDADAVYFDVFGRSIVRWPGNRTLALAILAVFLLIAQALWLAYKKRLAASQILWGTCGWLAIFIATGLLGLALRLMLAIAGATPVAWVAYPLPMEIAFALLGIALMIAGGSLAARAAGFWGLWAGAWAWGALASIILAIASPGLSYIVLVPALAAVVASLPAVLLPREYRWTRDLALLLPLAASAIVQMPLILLLYRGIGNQALVGIALAAALLVTPLFPLCSDLRQIPGIGGFSLRWTPFAAVALAAFAATVVPAYSARSPERVNFDYALDGDSGMARWVVYPDSGRLQAAIQLAGAFQRAEHRAFPWDTRASFVADAPHLDFAAPTFTILDSSVEGNRRRYSALLRSERAAPEGAIFFPPGSNVAGVRMEGQLVEPESPRAARFFNGWTAYSCPRIPPAGLN
ncbi:MAG: M28 family peptidase, partial [Acidobacteriota bacterium]|nr:M28 family peptidase [Acidobacteriota bacterium]